eukprot:6180143-Pleurochrysis_carterae.AAC.7
MELLRLCEYSDPSRAVICSNCCALGGSVRGYNADIPRQRGPVPPRSSRFRASLEAGVDGTPMAATYIRSLRRVMRCVLDRRVFPRPRSEQAD